MPMTVSALTALALAEAPAKGRHNRPMSRPSPTAPA